MRAIWEKRLARSQAEIMSARRHYPSNNHASRTRVEWKLETIPSGRVMVATLEALLPQSLALALASLF
jgi:hypothetical protein